MKLVIFGPPGSGKGTYASRLEAKLGLSVIAMGDIFREIMKKDTKLGREVRGFVEKGQLVPDSVVIKVLKERLSELAGKKGFILDGFPRTIEQALALEDLIKIDAVVRLIVPDWIIIERLSSRRQCKKCGEIYNIRFLKPRIAGVCDKCGGELFQRSDDTPKVIEDRIGVYERQTEPILQFYEERNTPIIQFSCQSLDMPPEVAVLSIIEQLKQKDLI